MKKTMTLLVVLASLSWSQTVVNLPNSVTVSADATGSLNPWMRGQLSGLGTVSTQSINAAAVTLNVVSTAGIATDALVLIDSEVLQMSAKTATQITFTRGALGTTPASHASGVPVYELKYKSFRVLFLSIINSHVSDIMDQFPFGTLVTQEGVISTAKAAKQSAKDGAVQ